MRCSSQVNPVVELSVAAILCFCRQSGLIFVLRFLRWMDPSKTFIPRLLEGFSVRVPTESELKAEIAETPDSWFIFSKFFKSGWTLPMPSAVAEFLVLTNLAPC